MSPSTLSRRHPSRKRSRSATSCVMCIAVTTAAIERAYAIEPRAARSSRATGTRTRGALRRRNAGSGASALGGPRRVRSR